LIIGGKELLSNATLKLVKGRKYGLVGRNGIGKTCLINSICRHEIEKFPKSIHVLQVEQECPSDDMTVLDHILNCDVERNTLLKEMNKLTKAKDEEMDAESKAIATMRIAEISERLEVIGSAEAVPKAIQILTGIGFGMQELTKPAKNFSGGWRMRIAIAKVIFCEPEILLLDEPTNHLDLNALIWLENYVKKLDIAILMVSHARDFLNATVDEIIHF
jgi:ATP-binding cassette subfamily F protein 3